MTPEMLSLQWNTVSLYPAGYFTRGISVAATVKYPAGWTAYSGLPSNATGSSDAYQKTDYETLIDSPTIAGTYTKQFALGDGVLLDVVAATPDELKAKPQQVEAHNLQVGREVKHFGSHNYEISVYATRCSDNYGSSGLE